MKEAQPITGFIARLAQTKNLYGIGRILREVTSVAPLPKVPPSLVYTCPVAPFGVADLLLIVTVNFSTGLK